MNPLHVHRNGQPRAVRDELERLVYDDGAWREDPLLDDRDAVALHPRRRRGKAGAR